MKFEKKKPASLQKDPYSGWEDRSSTLAEHPNKQIYKALTNHTFSVQFSKFTCNDGEMVHLWIKAHSNRELSWKEKQKIKEAVIGKDRWAIECYPSEKDLVDVAWMYHLYVFPEGYSPTFGLHTSQASE